MYMKSIEIVSQGTSSQRTARLLTAMISPKLYSLSQYIVCVLYYLRGDIMLLLN